MAESLLKDQAHFIVDVIASFKGAVGKVLVIVDGDAGIGIDDCADLSRVLSKALDDSNLISGAFNLEVSTPGLISHWSKAPVHKTSGVTFRYGGRNKPMRVGWLLRLMKTVFSLRNWLAQARRKKKTIEIPFDKIDKTIVLVSFK